MSFGEIGFPLKNAMEEPQLDINEFLPVTIEIIHRNRRFFALKCPKFLDTISHVEKILYVFAFVSRNVKCL